MFKMPYTNFHEINLDWVLSKVKELETELHKFVKLNTIKYANPIAWNITSQYEVNTVVIDPQTGNAYLSVAPVPNGVSITDTEYWTSIFNYQQEIDRVDGRIDDINDRVDEVSTELNTLDTEVEELSDSTDARIDEVNARIDAIIPTLQNNQSVKYYGAVGDGETDDTDAILECIQNSDVIYFPSGTYKVTRRLTCGDNKTFFGEQNAIIHCTFDNAPILTLLGGNSMVYNLNFEGNKGLAGHEGEEFNHAISLNDPENCFVYNCRIKNVFGDGVYLGNGNYQTHIASKVIVNNCTMINCGRHGISVISNDSFIINNCIIKDCDNRFAIDIEPNYSGMQLAGTISNLYTENNKYGSVHMFVNVHVDRLNLTLNNITSVGDGYGTLDYTSVFAFQDHHETNNNTGTIITNNITCRDTRGIGLYLEGMDARVKFVGTNWLFDHHIGENTLYFGTIGSLDISGYFSLGFDVINKAGSNTKLITVFNGGGQLLHKVFLDYAGTWDPSSYDIPVGNEVFLSDNAINTVVGLKINANGTIASSTMGGFQCSKVGNGRYRITPPPSITNFTMIGTATTENTAYPVGVDGRYPNQYIDVASVGERDVSFSILIHLVSANSRRTSVAYRTTRYASV